MSNRNTMTIFAPLELKSQKLAFITASARSCDPIDKDATAVKLQATQDCFVEFSGKTADKTGTAGVGTGVTKNISMLLKAGAIEYFPLAAGSALGQTISVIGDSAAGDIYITPLSE